MNAQQLYECRKRCTDLQTHLDAVNATLDGARERYIRAEKELVVRQDADVLRALIILRAAGHLELPPFRALKIVNGVRAIRDRLTT